MKQVRPDGKFMESPSPSPKESPIRLPGLPVVRHESAPTSGSPSSQPLVNGGGVEMFLKEIEWLEKDKSIQGLGPSLVWHLRDFSRHSFFLNGRLNSPE